MRLAVSLPHQHKVYVALILEHWPFAALLCRAATMRAPPKLRLEAHAAWVAAAEVLMSKGLPLSQRRIMGEAIKIFNRRSPSHGLSTGGIARFINKWRQRVEGTGSVADLPGRGRKSKLTEEMARQAVEILAEGAVDEQGDHTPYFDIHEAVAASVELRNILKEANLKPLTLWRRLVKFDKGLKRRMMQFKPELSPEQCAARKAACQLLLGLGDRLADYLKRTFWIDAKKYIIRPKKCKVICHSSRLRPHLTHPRASIARKDTIIVHWYAAVNYFEGPVLWVEVTGTTLNRGERWKIYKVGGGRLGVYNGAILPATISPIALKKYSPHIDSSLQCKRKDFSPLACASRSHWSSLAILSNNSCCCLVLSIGISLSCEGPSW